MKKVGKSAKSVVTSESVESSSTAAAPVAGAPVVAAAPAVVTTMADPAVQACLTLLDQVIGKVGAQPALNQNQVRRATKMRKGGAEVIPKILALCQQHGITKIGSLTTQEMSEQLQRGDALVQVGLRSVIVQKKVRESAMSAHGRSWQIGTTMYATLRRMAKDDPELALGLQPVESFFQTVRTKGKVRANKKASDAKKAAKAGEVNLAEATASTSAAANPPTPPPAPVADVAPVPVANEASAAPPAAPAPVASH